MKQRTWAAAGAGLLIALGLGASTVSLAERPRALDGEARRSGWSAGWEQLGESFDEAGAPALVPGDDGSVELYLPHLGKLHERRLTAGAWGPWSPGEAVSLAPGVSMSDGLAATRSSDGAVWMVARGSDDSSWYRTRSPGGAWGAWSSAGGSTRHAPAVSSTANGGVQIWSLGHDGQVYLKRQPGGSSHWRALVLPGGVTAVGAASAVGAGNKAHVAVLGSDDSYYVGEWDDASGTWGGFSSLGRGGSSRGQRPPALAYHGRVSLFAADSSRLWRRELSDSWGPWSDAPSKSGRALSLPSQATALAALGSPSSSDVRLVMSGQSGGLYYRYWYEKSPPPSVVLGPDRALLGQSSSGQVGCEGNWMWESVAVAVPPGQAGCGDAGAVVYDMSQDLGSAPGVEHNIWKGSLDCFRGGSDVARDDAGAPLTCTGSASQRCDTSRYNVFSPDAGWPTGLTTLSGGPPAAGAPPDGGGYGAGDDQIVRVGGAGDTLLMLKGTRFASNASYTSPNYRGGVIPYRSTSCAEAWSMSDVLIDPCDSNLGYSITYCSDNGGLDRPDIVVSPANPSTVRVIVTGGAGVSGDTDTLFYTSTNAGQTWSAQMDSSSGMSAMMVRGGAVAAAPVGDSVAIVYAIPDASPPPSGCGGHWHPALYSLDGADHFGPNTALIDGQSRLWFTSDCMGWAPGVDLRRNLFTISPVRQYWDGQYVRVAYPMRNGNDQMFRVRILHWRGGAGGQVDDVGSFDVASATGSIVHLNAVYPNRLDGAPPSSVGLFYWYETSGHAPAFGTATAKGCIVRDLDTTCTPFTLSMNEPGSARSWTYTGDHQAPGDYLKGSFFYAPDDPDGKTLQFFVHWLEWPTSSPQRYSVHANIVKVAP